MSPKPLQTFSNLQRGAFAMALLCCTAGGTILASGRSPLAEWIIAIQISVFGGFTHFWTTFALLTITLIAPLIFLSLVTRGTLLDRTLDALRMPKRFLFGGLVGIGAFAMLVSVTGSLNQPDTQNALRALNTYEKVPLDDIERAAQHPRTKIHLTASPLNDRAATWRVPTLNGRYSSSTPEYETYTPMGSFTDPQDMAEYAVFYQSIQSRQADAAELRLPSAPFVFVQKKKLPVAIRHEFEKMDVPLAAETYILVKIAPSTYRSKFAIVTITCWTVAVILYFAMLIIRPASKTI